VGSRYGRTLVIILSIMALASLPAQAQIVSIQGPGIPPEGPLQVVVNPPDGFEEVEYEYTNLTSAAALIQPALTCPPATVKAEIEDTPFILGPSPGPDSSRRVKARFADLPGGAAAGQMIQCQINGAGMNVRIAVIIVPAPLLPKLGGTAGMTISLIPSSPVGQTEPNKISDVSVGLAYSLSLTFTLSDLTMTSLTALSFTGIDSETLRFSSTIGGLSMTGSLVFAVPFNSAGTRLGPITFVSKQITTTLTFSGLTFSNTFTYQDIAFPHAPSDPPQFQVTDVLTISGVATQGFFFSASTTFRIPPGGILQPVSESLTLANVKIAGVTNFFSAQIVFTGASAGLASLILFSSATLNPFNLTINNFVTFGPDLVPILDILSVAFQIGDFSTTATFSILPGVTGAFNVHTISLQNSLTLDRFNVTDSVILCVDTICIVPILQHTILLSALFEDLSFSSSTQFSGDLFREFSQEVLTFSLVLAQFTLSSTTTLGPDRLISQVFSFSIQF
jgi:hypothetical protein